jgi:hypothetical protein
MSDRIRITITANDKTYTLGQTAAEQTAVSHAVNVVTDPRGVMTARPSHYETTVNRLMNPRNGQLTLLQVAVASQRFNLLAKDATKHPKATITEQVRRGNQWVDLHCTKLSDFQPSEYSLTWSGEGSDGLNGCTIHESIALLSSSGEETDMINPDPAPFVLT